MKGFRHVLVPVDFSPMASRVVEMAAGLVAPEGVLRLLHIVEWVPGVVEGTFVGYADPKQTRSLHAESERKLEEYARAVKGPRVEREVVDGNPTEVILEVAERVGADLIAMATHGRTGIGHFLVGSVAEKVIHRAPCPVLAVRG